MDTPANGAGTRRLMAVLWPGFLLACLLQLLVFGLVDPGDLHWGGGTLKGSRQSVYTLAFFAFWLLSSLSSALTVLLVLPAAQLNAREQGIAPDA